MLLEPHVLHPAFYGCFDWHSAVHGHWMLIRLLKQFPDLPEADRIRKTIGENITVEHIAAEVDYFKQASRSWERTYGWAWLLKLAEELYTWQDVQGQQWYDHLQPLVDVIIERYMTFLQVQHYPVRTGVHPNTAFGLAFAWDYAATTNSKAFRELIEERAKFYFLKDVNCPASYEPSGEDFLSACLEEAQLMSRILEPADFDGWFRGFLPPEQLGFFQKPADVSDRSDPKIVHLDGLNLSRAWCLYAIQKALPDEAFRNQLKAFARLHLEASVYHISSEHYEGSHWLASFAVYALSN
jgi:hypothetical protein